MANPPVTVIDYGMGNIWSVLAALRFLKAEAHVSAIPDEIASAEFLILPGVGSFRRAMESLRASEIDRAILTAVTGRRAKLLGICLGMQMLGCAGSEDGETEGLGLINCRIDRFTSTELCGNKIPHIGFNAVKKAEKSLLFDGLPDGSDFYFVHSYRMMPAGTPGLVSTCKHGIEFVAGIEVGNVFGVQFHPEKSQTNGLRLLENFLRA